MAVFTYLSALLLMLGLATTLVGYWFLAKSEGEAQCTAPVSTQSANNAGGISGLVLGLTAVLAALIVAYFTTD